MHFALDDEQELVVSTVRRFAQREIGPAAAEADRQGLAPDALLAAAGELGLFLDAVPAAADGLLEGEYSHLTRALRSYELARGCAGITALLESNVEPALAVTRWGSAGAKEALFKSLAEGGLCALYRDFTGQLSATRTGGSLFLSGRIGPAPALATATHVLVAADHGENPALLLLATEGRAQAATPSGWRAAGWATLSCDAIPVDNRLILASGSDAIAATTELLAWHRANLAARAAAVAHHAIDCAARYGEERIQFGRPIGTFESLARMRDENQTRADAARLLALEAAALLDRGDSRGPDAASRARDFAREVVSRATIDAVQMYGGYGFVNDYPVEKLMRDATPFGAVAGDEGFDRILSRRCGAA